MPHLVVCCDGTWNTPAQAQDGVPTPTNVVRLHHALAENGGQLRYYHPGVGTGPGLGDRLAGGGLGLGLSANIKSAYSWWATHYEPGDAICLFGFSRGAYTARSLVGMLAACGLPNIPADTPESQRWEHIDALYDEVYRPAKGQQVDRPPYSPPPIKFLGVWDTVGALGIPKQLGLLTLLDVDHRHEFHNTALSDQVEHARHAVAIDEHRGPFTPTLWTGLEKRPAGTSVRQIWFPGDHCDVGGGHPQTGLSDAALKWMLEEAEQTTKLRFQPRMKAQIQPNPQDVQHDSCTGIYRYLSPAPRPTPAVTALNPDHALAESTLARHLDPPLSVGEYWPTKVLQPGHSETVPIYASQPWNHTGLYLPEGNYQFQASGQWLNGSTPTGPTGTARISLRPESLLQLAGSFTGWFEEHFRNWTHNQAATFFGAPRVADASWMSLIGTVSARRFDASHGYALAPYKPFRIGDNLEQHVDESGYLFAYANDAWGFYANSRGSLRLTVSRQRRNGSSIAGAPATSIDRPVCRLNGSTPIDTSASNQSCRCSDN